MHQQHAILKLLQEDDRETLALVKAQLGKRGLGALPELRDLLGAADPRSAAHLRDVIAEIEHRHAETIFEQLCASFGEHGPIEEAAWRLAAIFLPAEDFGTARGLLDHWGAEVSRRLGKAETGRDRIETLVEFLGMEVGLRGNEGDYYNLNNSLLPEVIETRRGLPITLSLIYMLVGGRAGLTLHGVGLPGHFIVSHGKSFFDPFHGGRELRLDECRDLLQQQKLALMPAHLQPVTPRQMLARMLSNIHRLAEESDPPLASKIAHWLELLQATDGRTPAA
jgi:regulator of sirC expression with transglutaminase-like and TPR domain